MNPDIVIRDETPADVDAIAAVTVTAFRDMAISNHTEQIIVAALCAAGALTISLVAELDGCIPRGSVMFHDAFMAQG